MTDGDGGWRMIPPPYPLPSEWAALAQRQREGDVPAQRWLSPFTPVSQYLATPRRDATAPMAWPPAVALQTPREHAVNSASSPATFTGGGYGPATELGSQGYGREEEEEEEDGEYEYGYVLRDEWRQYLRETVLSDCDDDDNGDASTGSASSVPIQRRPHNRREKTHQEQKINAKTARQPLKVSKRPTPVVQLTRPLELALDDARAVEKQRQRDRQAAQRDGTSWQRVDLLETALHAQFEAFCDRHTPTVWPQGAS